MTEQERIKRLHEFFTGARGPYTGVWADFEALVGDYDLTKGALAIANTECEALAVEVARLNRELSKR